MTHSSFIRLLVLCAAMVGSAIAGTTVFAATAKEQFIPMFTFKEGPAGPLGIATNAGYLDYFTLLNERDGGIGGVKITWEECEFTRVLEKGLACYEKLKHKGPTGASMINPGATDLAYALLKRSVVDKIPIITGGYGRTDATDGRVFPYMFPYSTNYWNQATAMVRYIGLRLGGMKRLEGKTIVNLHHDSGFGREPNKVLDIEAQKYGFKMVHIAVPNPGKEQDEQWKKILELKPDWVILWGIGVMNPVALMTAHKYGYPSSRILGVTWAGAEADVIPAGAAAKGYIAAAGTLPGRNFPVIQEILNRLYAKGKGNVPDPNGIVGSTYYNRAVSGGLFMAEAIRTAQARFGKRPLTGEEIRWGLENVNLTDRRIAELGAFGISQPMHLSCDNHEGGGQIRFQRWNGKEWTPVTGWIDGDQAVVRPLIEKSATDYAKQEKIPVRDCAKEAQSLAKSL